MKKILVVAFAGLLLGLSATAQQLYMPRNVAAAYKNGTRSVDGKPGPKYWQNKAVYSISVSVAPPGRTVTGTEEITYTNNSPYSLTELFFRLELNSHQPESPREQPVSSDYLTSGIQIDQFTVNGAPKVWRDQKGLTFASF
jgi:hypothetical protein